MKKVRTAVDVLEPSLSSVFRLFTNSYAVVLVTTLAIQALRSRNQPNSEYWDDGIYLCALLAGLIIARDILRTNRVGKSYLLLGALAISGILLGIAGREPLGFNQLWNGFGWGPLFLAVLLAPWVWRVVHYESINTKAKYLIRTAVAVVTLFSFISVYQGMNSVIYSYPASFIINESLSVAAGHWPYVDFIPQYQIGYSFWFAIFEPFLTSAQLVEFSLVFMSFIFVATLVLSALIVRACLPSRSITVALALVVPFTCVVPFSGRIGYRGSIAEFHSAIPVRIFPGVAIVGLICWGLFKVKKSLIILKTAATCVGFTCGLVLWHSQDFGLALVLSILTGLLLLHYLAVLRAKSIVICWSIGAVIGFAAYPGISFALGRRVNILDYGFFLRQFGGGYGSQPIHTPGPILVILPTIIGVLVCCLWILKLSNRFPSNVSCDLKFSASTGLFFSIWILASFPYYINRSFAAGMLQTFLLPVAIAIGALVGSILNLEKITRKVGGDCSLLATSRFFQWKGLFLWPLSLIASLLFASALLTPDPRVELKRLTGSVPQTTWSLSSMQTSIDDSNAAYYYASSVGVTVGFVGLLGNYVQIESGIESVSIFNSPDDILATKASEAAFCKYLLSRDMDYLVLGERAPEILNYFPDNVLCGKYEVTDLPGVRAGHAMKSIS